MRERYTVTREGADHVVKLTVYKPRRRSRGHVLIKNLAHCEERIFDFVVSRFLRGKLSQNLLEYRKYVRVVSFFVHNFVRSLSRKFHRLKKQLIILFSSLLQNDYIFFYFSWIFSEYLSIFLVLTKVNIFNAYLFHVFFFSKSSKLN